jgi:flagellar hook-associated protein 1 FlgK
MSGLFESLSSAANALTAHRLGLDVVGQNMANVNTEGYTRRRILLAELAPTDALSAGRGVEVLGALSLRDTLADARVRREQQGASFDDGLLEALSTVERTIGLPGASLDARLTAFFDAFAGLASDVTSATARDAVVQQAVLLTRAFGDQATGLAQAQRDADAAIRSAVRDINGLTTTIAAMNAQIVAGGPDVETIRDRQTLALEQLAELVDVAVIARADGGVDVTIGNGRALVIGASSYAVDVTASGPATLTLEGVDITASITGGRVGGFIHARDVLIPSYQSRLDRLAFDLAGAINAAHAAGFDANGAAGGAFFTPPATVAGAAAALAVDPALAADSALIAASGTGSPGDNQAARALAALRDAPIVAGNSLSVAEAWGGLAQAVGHDVAATRASSETRAQIVLQMQRLRDQASGVSLDEEAANLMKFQRAYQASARYFTTISDTLDTLMEMVR